ncbi:diguanylate cyclase [Coralloluteibacterium stylophorae]|uniref:diguanylate cyclase n=1 Tax=Coralloluteibacterium stylophorae TaxID=1776034 RepID=A0A8J7VRV3_9GAMM|nr:diguanylate cyclase [Coralloluteibacterium stylophorae]
MPTLAGRRRLRACLAVAALACAVAAGGVAAQSFPLRGYGTADGLRSLSASCLAEDADGVLWVCTYSGLYRHDGDRFERIDAASGLRDAVILDVAPDPAGGLWIGGAADLYRWTGERAERVAGVDGRGLAADAGASIAALADGAVVLSGERALRVVADGAGGWRTGPLFDAATEAATPALRSLGAVYADGGALWFGCGEGICRRAEDGAIATFGPAQGVAADTWTDFLRDRGGRLWARSPLHVAVLEPGAAAFAERPLPVALTTTTSNLDIVEDAAGRILTRTDSGLARWADGRWQVFDARNGLPDGAATALASGRNGQLWMAYPGHGVLRWLGYGRIENWDATVGLTGTPTWSILRDADGRMLIGNNTGGGRIDPAAGRVVDWQLGGDTPARTVVGLTTGPRQALWVTLFRGQLLRRDARGTALVATLPHRIKRAFFDRDGRLWLCTLRGVYRIDDPLRDGTPRRVEDVPEVGFGDGMQDAAGRVWLAGKPGLFRYADGRWTRIRVSGDVPSQRFDKLSVGSDDVLWVSVDNAGLFRGRVDGDALRLEAVDDPLLAQSLPYFIRHDVRGRLWVGGSMGVDVHADGRWAHLGQAGGLVSDDVSEGAFFADADGSVWIGTSLGVTHVLEPEALFAGAPLEVRIARAERGGQPLDDGAVLPWGRQAVRLTLSTPGVVGSDLLRFRYRLRGRQDDWIETGARTLDFPVLESGQQVIEVQAIDLGRRLRSGVTHFAFRIAPPWWRSPPALAAWSALGLLLLGGLWRWRVRRIRTRERELEALVAARTRELEDDKRALEQARAALQVQATHDSLTGLRNRAGILAALEQECARARAGGQPLAVALIDLDHFKRINDTHGHLAGDAVLVQIAARLSARMRGSDTVGRYGGEELLVVLPGLVAPAGGRLQALHEAVCGSPMEIEGESLRVTCSIGVAWLRAGDAPTALLRRADAALYRAKHAGRDRVVAETAAD